MLRLQAMASSQPLVNITFLDPITSKLCRIRRHVLKNVAWVDVLVSGRISAFLSL